MVEKQLPHNIDVEESLLGAVLLDGTVMRNLQLEAPDFYSDRNRQVFDACVKLYSDRRPIDQITVAHELGDKLKEIGGMSYLSHVIGMCPTPLEAPEYSRLLKKLGACRNLIAYAEQVQALGYAQGEPDKTIEQANTLWSDFKSHYSTNSKIISPITAANDIIALMSKYAEPTNAPRWGFLALDKITAGIHPEYHIFGARPSVGKTQLLLDITENLLNQKKYVLLASAEMLENQIYERKIARTIRKSILEIRQNGLTTEQQTLISEMAGPVSESTIHYLTGSLYLREVYLEALKLREKGMLDAVVLDYLGALRDCYSDNRDSQTTRISRVSNQIQAYTHELRVPWLVACQLNREVEHRADGRGPVKARKPQLADLRDSGSLEQDADVVFLLHREIEEDKMSPYLKIKMAKNRQLGEAKSVTLQYNYNLYRYADPENREEEF